jgi:hypothetical protein
MFRVEHLVNTYKPKGKEYSDTTKSDYTRAFRILADIFSTDDFVTLFTDRYEHVIAVLNERYKSNMYWYKVNTFCKFYEIPYREVPLQPDNTFDIPVYDIAELRNKIAKIRDLKSKVILLLLANTTDHCVRRDWATVMVREYCNEDEIKSARALYTVATGHFEFIELNKTGRSIDFVIEETTRELLVEYIEELEDKRYFYNYNTKEEPTESKRTNSFSHFITRITKKYLGKKMSVNDFRKAMELESATKWMNSDDPDALHQFAASAARKDHSIGTAVKYYVSSVGKAPMEEKAPKDHVEVLVEDHVEVDAAPVEAPKDPVKVPVKVPMEVPVKVPMEDIIDMIITLTRLGKTRDEILEIVKP